MSSLVSLIALILSRLAGKYLTGWVFVFFSVALPLISKVIALLSFTTVSLIGINLVFNKLSSHFLTSAKGLPNDVFHIIGIMKSMVRTVFKNITSRAARLAMINHELNETQVKWRVLKNTNPLINNRI